MCNKNKLADAQRGGIESERDREIHKKIMMLQ